MVRLTPRLITFLFLSILTVACSSIDPIDPEIKVERQRAVLQQPIKNGEWIPIGFARQLLIGRWSGKLCQGSEEVEINITNVDNYEVGGHLKVSGAFKSRNLTSSVETDTFIPVVNTTLKGQFSLQTGFLRLLSPPTPQGRVKHVFTISIDIARTMDGQGWAGYFGGFAYCQNEIRLTSTRGATTEKFPPINSEIAFKRALPNEFQEDLLTGQLVATKETLASYKIDALPAAFQIYWLNVAVGQGKNDAILHLAKAYEKQAEFFPEAYQQALQHYRAAAATNDVRAQEALAHMHANGLGTRADLAEAQRWRTLANETKQVATKACTSPESVAAIKSILQMEAPLRQGINNLTEMVSGMRVEEKGVRLEEVRAGDVVSLDKPFTCRVRVLRLDPKVDIASTPDDDQLDKAFKDGTANVVQQWVKANAYQDQYPIVRVGDHRFKISSKDIKYSVIVDLH